MIAYRKVKGYLKRIHSRTWQCTEKISTAKFVFGVVCLKRIWNKKQISIQDFRHLSLNHAEQCRDEDLGTDYLEQCLFDIMRWVASWCQTLFELYCPLVGNQVKKGRAFRFYLIFRAYYPGVLTTNTVLFWQKNFLHMRHIFSRRQSLLRIFQVLEKWSLPIKSNNFK